MTDPVREFIGIYDANSTLLGEISYWIGARLGRTHCSLCELTHGLFTVKNEWKECERSLAVPFRTYHRNDAPKDVLDVVAGSFPVVLARTDRALNVILTGSQLEAFGGSTDRFAEWLKNFS